MQFGLKVRVGLTLSAIWICIVALTANEYQSGTTTFGIAALPLVVLWGLGWSVSGWLEKRRLAVTSGSAPAGSRMLPALKYAALVLTVVVLGIIGAHMYANFRDAEAAQVDIARLVGEWSVYSALAYVALRLAPGYTRKTPGLLTALVFIVGLNYSSYKQVDLLVRTKQSLAVATPLFMKVQSGGIIDEAEIKSANVGFFEPFLLAVADSNKRLVLAQRRYEKEINESGFGEVLAPSSLASPSGRVRARAVIANVERITNEYLIEAEAAFKAGKASVKSTVVQMPNEYASVFEGYARTADESLNQLQRLRDIEARLFRCASDIVALIESAPGGVKASPGPQPLLIFSSDETNHAYNNLIGRFSDIAREEAQLNEQVMRERIEKVERLTNSLSPTN